MALGCRCILSSAVVGGCSTLKCKCLNRPSKLWSRSLCSVCFAFSISVKTRQTATTQASQSERPSQARDEGVCSPCSTPLLWLARGSHRICPLPKIKGKLKKGWGRMPIAEEVPWNRDFGWMSKDPQVLFIGWARKTSKFEGRNVLSCPRLF